MKNLFFYFKEENVEWLGGEGGGGGWGGGEDKSKKWHYWTVRIKKSETVRLWETYFWD